MSDHLGGRGGALVDAPEADGGGAGGGQGPAEAFHVNARVGLYRRPAGPAARLAEGRSCWECVKHPPGATPHLSEPLHSTALQGLLYSLTCPWNPARPGSPEAALVKATSDLWCYIRGPSPTPDPARSLSSMTRCLPSSSPEQQGGGDQCLCGSRGGGGSPGLHCGLQGPT